MIKKAKWPFRLLFAIFLTTQAQAQQTLTLDDFHALIGAGRYDEARSLMRMVSQNPIDQAMLEIEINEAQGNFTRAIALLRELLAINPGLDLARFKLAELLVANNQLQNARYQYELLRSHAVLDADRQFLTEKIRGIDEISPYSLNFMAELTPSNNINNASDAKTELGLFGPVSIPDELRPQSGWRAALGVDASYRTPIVDQYDLVTIMSVQTAKYDVPTLNYDTAYIGLNFRRIDARSEFQIGPFLSRFWGDGDVYSSNVNFVTGESVAEIASRDEDYTAIGFSSYYRYVLDAGSSIAFNYRFSNQQYDDWDYFESRRSRDNEFSITYSKAINAQNLLSLNAGIERHLELGNRNDWKSFNSYVAKTVGFSLQTQFENQFQSEIGLQYTDRGYDDLYPFRTFKRQDEVWNVNFNLLNSKWQIGQFVPKLSCGYSWNDSNIETESITSGQCGINLTTQF